MTVDLRLQLRNNGYDPLPLIGKAPALKEWQKRTDTSEADIRSWSKLFPNATNTGVLTRLVPTLDLDILDEDAVRTIGEMVCAEHGSELLRIGRPPKLAIPFRSDEPFAKINANLTAPNGSTHKIEFLGNGQQFVVNGIHPDTHTPYRWFGGSPADTKREDLPYIHQATAHALVEAIVATLERKHGYRLLNLVRGDPRSLISPFASSGDDRAGAAPSSAGNEKRRNGPPVCEAELPKALYFKMLELVPLSAGVSRRDQRRVRGLLRTVTQKSMGRNDALNWAAFSFCELIEAGIVSREAAECLLFDAATLNGYVAKDGPDEAMRTIRSGLDTGGPSSSFTDEGTA